MPKVILDTNVLLDIFVFMNPSVLGIWEQCLSGHLDFYCSSSTLKEFKNKLADEKFSFPPEEQKKAFESYSAHAKLIESDSLFPAKCKDPEDQKFLDLAFSLAPSYLVTWDKMVLKLRKRARKEGFSILDPKNFLAISQLPLATK